MAHGLSVKSHFLRKWVKITDAGQLTLFDFVHIGNLSEFGEKTSFSKNWPNQSSPYHSNNVHYNKHYQLPIISPHKTVLKIVIEYSLGSSPLKGVL